MTRASTTLIWFSLTIFVSLGLYHTSYYVEELGRELRTLNREIEAEQRNIHVLKAEWVFLSNPSRIAIAAQRNLDLQPTSLQQVTDIVNLSSLISSRSSKMAHAKATNHLAHRIERYPAANKPHVVAEEEGRINTRLVIQKTASTDAFSSPSPLHLVEGSTYALAISGASQ